MPTNKAVLGLENPGDKKVPVRVRDWDAMKLGLWRSRRLSEIVITQALEIVELARHLPGCPGKDIETEPCVVPRYDAEGKLASEGCPDREIRMSAMVILSAARQLAPADARKPAEGPFFAPTREYYTEILAALTTSNIENRILRLKLREAGIESSLAENNNDEIGALFEAPHTIEENT